MEELPEQFCSNCKKHIGAANFATHSAFCQRNITICKVCKEPVPRNAVKEHEEEYHAIILCDFCNISIARWKLPHHQEMCPKRPFICEFCEADFPFDKAEKHVEFCGSRTEECSFCTKYIMLKDKKKHFKETCPKRPFVCEFCEADFPFDEAQEHVELCGSRIEECSFCPKLIMLKHRKKHFKFHQCEEKCRENGSGEVSQNIMNELISKTSEKGLRSNNKTPGSSEKSNSVIKDDCDFSSIEGATAAAAVPEKSKQTSSSESTVCHLCRQHVLWKEYERHITICANDKDPVRKCSHCGMLEHDRQTCPTLKQLKVEQLSRSKPETEYTFLRSYAELMEKGPPCPLCKEPCFPYDISEHLEVCPENYFQCALCCREILQRDKTTHLSTTCTMLQERNPYDMYECPLCFEKLPEKNKVTHESFYCKVLLQHDEGPLYSLTPQNSRDEKKKQKNSPSVCLYCKKEVPENELASHTQSCIKNSEKNCDYCDKQISVSLEKHHLEYCEVYDQIKKLDNRENDYNRKGAKPKYPKLSDVKLKVGKCTHCQTTLNENILLYHEEECVHQPIKCTDCGTVILLKDFDSHTCKSTKKKGKAGRKDHKSEKSSWYSNISNLFTNKSDARTIDQYQNDRNKLYADNMKNNRFTPLQNNKNEDLYFAQSAIDEPKIPCEFCDKMFPASEIVLHTTGCNPDEVSLPKPKDVADSIVTSQSFFPTGRGNLLLSPQRESIQKRLEQKSGARPGEYLSHYSDATSTSEKQFSSYQPNRKPNDLPSTLISVWNNDVSDVEMEDVNSEANALPQNIQEDVKEHSKNCLDKTEEPSIESDEEMTSMLDYIRDSPPSKNDMYTEECDNSERLVSNNSGIQSFQSLPKENVPSNNSNHHTMSYFSNNKRKDQDDLSKGANRMYSTILNSDTSKPKSYDEITKKDETVLTPDELAKLELSNFRFCDRGVKNSSHEAGKPQSYEIEDYDVYYKANALGYVIGSKGEELVIKRPSKKNDDMLRRKYMHQSDSITETSQEERTKSRVLHSSPSTPEKISEMLKYMHQYGNGTETNQEERTKSRAFDVSPSMPEKKYQMVRLKYMYQDNDDGIPTSQKEITRKKSDDVSSTMFERSKQMLKSKYHIQDYDDDIQTNLKEKSKRLTADVSSPMLEKSEEMLKSKYYIKDYDDDDDNQTNLKEKGKRMTADISSPMLEKSEEMLKSKYYIQDDDDDDDVQTNLKEKSKSMTEDVSSPMLKKLDEKSKYYTVCPMCREVIKWIDYNTHIPTCASGSGKCSRCFMEVSSFDFKEHYLRKCPKIREKASVTERNKNVLSSRINSYEQVLQSLISPESFDEKKSKENFENSRMKTSRDGNKMSCTDSYTHNNAPKSKPAFKIEPAESYCSEFGSGKSANYERNVRENHQKKVVESSKSSPNDDFDIEKWRKWRSKSSDDS